MSDSSNPRSTDYAALGFIANPFVGPSAPGAESQWVRLVGHAAANRLLAACQRARGRSVPVLVTMSEEIPEYYYRVSQNDMLARTVDDPELGIMALNIPLEMMRLGRIRGTLAELAELVVAVDMPETLASWYVPRLESLNTGVPESAGVEASELDEVRSSFENDPSGAVVRYLGYDAPALSMSEMDVVVHEAYLRQVGQSVDMTAEEEESDPTNATGENALVAEDAGEEGTVPSLEERVRDYLLAIAREELSPVMARAFRAFGMYGESLAAQELKITKAPRKTLAALLRFMNARWASVVVIYDSFDSWPMLDQTARLDVLASLTELRYLIGASGAMVVGVNEGVAPEIEEQFAAAEQVDWRFPEVHALSRGDRSFDAELVQRILDSASIDGTAPSDSSDSGLATLMKAADDDLATFSTMAHAAFEHAATRGVDKLDEEAISAGLAAVKSEGGA